MTQNKTEVNLTKPPIGIEPRDVWIKNRIEDVNGAISRYIDAGYYDHEKVVEWIHELTFLIRLLHTKLIV